MFCSINNSRWRCPQPNVNVSTKFGSVICASYLVLGCLGWDEGTMGRGLRQRQRRNGGGGEFRTERKAVVGRFCFNRNRCRPVICWRIFPGLCRGTSAHSKPSTSTASGFPRGRGTLPIRDKCTLHGEKATTFCGTLR